MVKLKMEMCQTKSRQQPKATNGSSTPRETPAPRVVLGLAPKQKCTLVQYNGRHTKLRNIHKKLKLKIIQDQQRPEGMF